MAEKDVDGFTLVTRQKRGGRVATRCKVVLTIPPSEGAPLPDLPSSGSIEKFRQKLINLKRRIVQTPLFASLVQALSSVKVSAVMCYGLGTLSIFRSQLQLALLCAIVEDKHDELAVYSYDPCHTAWEQCLLRQVCGFRVLEDNDLGRRMPDDVDQDSASVLLYYMPHCDRWLYCNVLVAQQANLKHVCILGNSFAGYVKRDSKDEDDAVSNATSVSMEMDFSLEPGDDSNLDKGMLFESFNDMRLITFPVAAGADMGTT